MSKRRRARILQATGLVAAILASSAGVVGAGEGRGTWSFTVTGADSLRAEDPSLSVDVFGPIAVGTLVQGFRNEGQEPVTGTVQPPDLPGWRLSASELDVAGRKIEPAAAARPSGARQARRPTPGVQQRSALAASVRSGEAATARARFEQTLPLEGGLFHLRIPGSAAEPTPASFLVTLHHPEPLSVVRSPSHEILVSEQGTRTLVELAPGQALGRKPFELEFSAGLREEPALTGYVSPERNGDRQLVAVLAPPEKPPAESIRPKRMIFVLDSSGSMAPMEKFLRARQALEASLRELGATDRFNIVEFHHEYSLFRPEPVQATQETLEAAGAWLKSLKPQGATRLLPALEAAFAQPHGDGRHDMLVVFTDGIVHDATEVETFLRGRIGAYRLFFVGIGADVEREQIFRFAEIGRGAAAFADDAAGIGSTLAVLFSSIAKPLMWDLEVDWGGVDVENVRPQPLPDLYAGRPVTVYGVIHGTPPAELKLRGKTVEGERVFSVVLPVQESEAP